jgi:hypothetical protein
LVAGEDLGPLVSDVVEEIGNAVRIARQLALEGRVKGGPRHRFAACQIGEADGSVPRYSPRPLGEPPSKMAPAG